MFLLWCWLQIVRFEQPFSVLVVMIAHEVVRWLLGVKVCEFCVVKVLFNSALAIVCLNVI